MEQQILQDNEGTQNSPKSNFLPISILVAGVLISGTILYVSANDSSGISGAGNQEPQKKVEISTEKNDLIIGDKNAKIQIVEFSDFQCPFCRSFWENAYPQIKKQYIDTGKAYIVYKHYPLSFHASASISAQASECGAKQGKFVEVHDAIFQAQLDLNPEELNDPSKLITIQYNREDLDKWVSGVEGIDIKKYIQCMKDAPDTKKIQDDTEYANKLVVNGTPTFFINGNRVVGAQPFEVFKSILDQVEPLP